MSSRYVVDGGECDGGIIVPTGEMRQSALWRCRLAWR
jgi:hypothetical protein